MGLFASLKFIGTRPTESVNMSTKSNAISIKYRPRSGRTRGWVLCIRNAGYEASLEPRKIYPTLPDDDAASHGQLRVIDESGEDYLFPKSLFVTVEVPAALRKAVLAAV